MCHKINKVVINNLNKSFKTRNLQSGLGLVLVHVYDKQIKRLIDCIHIGFVFFFSRIFHSYNDVIIAGEGLRNLGLCSAVMVF